MPERNVYVGNLSWDTRWQGLKDHMRQAGNVVRAEVFLESSGRSAGCGVVEFETPDEALYAMQTLNDSVLDGRRVHVREDRDRSRRGGAGAGGPPYGPGSQGADGFAFGIKGSGPASAFGNGSGAAPTAVHPFDSAMAGGFVGSTAFGADRAAGGGIGADELRRGVGAFSAHFDGTGGPLSGGGVLSNERNGLSGSAAGGFRGGSGREVELTRGGGYSGALGFGGGGGGGYGGFGGGGPYGGFDGGSAAGFGGYGGFGGGASGGVSSANVPPNRASGVGASGRFRSDRGRKIVVHNLPYHTRWQELKDAFRSVGEVIRADVIIGSDGRSKGIGTVVFEQEADAETAVAQMNGRDFEGRAIQVHMDRFD